MDIADTNAIGNHPLGPAFVWDAKHHAYETKDGVLCAGLDIPAMIQWLEKDPTDLARIEAFALTTNANGMVFLHSRWLAGERSLSMLFVQKAQPLVAGDGTKFFYFNPLYIARSLAEKRAHRHAQGPVEASVIHNFLHEILAIHGLRANMERIDYELCTTCGKKKVAPVIKATLTEESTAH